MEQRRPRRALGCEAGAGARRLHAMRSPSATLTWRAGLVLGTWDLEFPATLRLAGDTSKGLDKYVVVRVILHGQCSLQRKEAI